jgi:hypothetical protein
MDCVAVGAVWIDGTIEEYFDSLFEGIYEEIDEDIPPEDASVSAARTDGLE